MLKSIRNIIILMIILTIVGVIPYIILLETSSEIKDLSRDTSIVINNDGKMEITEKVTFTPKRVKKCLL